MSNHFVNGPCLVFKVFLIRKSSCCRIFGETPVPDTPDATTATTQQSSTIQVGQSDHLEPTPLHSPPRILLIRNPSIQLKSSSSHLLFSPKCPPEPALASSMHRELSAPRSGNLSTVAFKVHHRRPPPNLLRVHSNGYGTAPLDLKQCISGIVLSRSSSNDL